MTFEEEEQLRRDQRMLAMADMPLPAHVPDRPAGIPAGDLPAPVDTPPVVAAPRPAPVAPTTVAPTPPAVTQPITPPPPTKTTTADETSTTTSRTKISKEERDAQDKLQATRTEQEGVVRQAGDLAAQQADMEAEKAERKRQLLEQHGEKLTELTKTADAEMAKRMSDYDQAQAAYKTAEPRDFWTYTDDGKKRTEDQVAKKRFWAGIAMALGGFTEREQGRNTAYDMISGAIERRDKLEQARIARLKDVAHEAKEGIQVARTKKADALADLSAWKVAALDLGASEIESRLAKLGRPAEEIKTNANVLKLREDAQKERAKFLEATRVDIKSTVVRRTQDIVGGAGAGGAGSKVTGTDIENVARLDADLANMDRLIETIGKKPTSWLEYRSNAEKWQRAEAMKGGLMGTLRQGFQATGLGSGPGKAIGNIAPEQGLRTSAAKRVHGDLTRVQNSIAKGYGGVITDSDRGSAASEISALAATPTEMLANLQRARRTLQEKRDLYMANKRIADPNTPPASAPQAQTAKPAGGRKVRLKDGTVGTLYPDGSFEEQSPVAAAR